MTLWEKLILPIAQGNTALQHLGSAGLDVPHHQLLHDLLGVAVVTLLLLLDWPLVLIMQRSENKMNYSSLGHKQVLPSPI